MVVRVKPTTAADFRALSAVELIESAQKLKAEYTKLQYLKRSRGKVQNPENIQVSCLYGMEPGALGSSASPACGCLRSATPFANLISLMLLKQHVLSHGIGCHG